MSLKTDHQKLISWYESHRRDLPWRISKDAYRIWISEVMLQQTTVAAVVPYYEKFMTLFPDVHVLANSPLEKVLENWSGLGYYTRARNLHKAAQILSKKGFPKSYLDLLEIPGMGPYTSRAVSSLAFDEKVGVLDGNVIRVLARKYGISTEWWKTPGRNELQMISDSLAQFGQSANLNQALMELGATICTPQKVSCGICPWNKNCLALSESKIELLPLKKPRKKSEIWIWKVNFQKKNNKIGLIKNEYAPFLKGQMIFPGTIEKSKIKPKLFSVKHSITHHDIFIQKIMAPAPKNLKWIPIQDLKKINPATIMSKVIHSMSAICLIILLSTSLISCSSKSKRNDPSQLVIKSIPRPEPILQKFDEVEKFGIVPLNLLGQNEKIAISPDGQKFAYISNERPYAKGTEIYEMDLILNKERRITFQDGLINSIKYLNPQQIFYTSNTDEIKEALWSEPEPDSGSAHNNLPAQDIYLSDTYGSNIVRLTKSPGFEGDFIYLSDLQEPKLLYTSLEKKYLVLKELNLLTNETKNFKEENHIHHFSPALNSQRKIISWIRYDDVKNISTIEMYSMKKNLTKTFLEIPGRASELKWIQYSDLVTKEALIYTIEGENHLHHIEFTTIANPCRKLLLDLSEINCSTINPEFNPGPKPELYFTLINGNSKTIYKKPFTEPNGTCIQETSSDKIK